MEQIRFIQRNGKNILRRDILRILVAVTQSFNVKRCPLSLKFCNLIICISLNRLYVVDNNLHKSVKILISEQYFTLLEWFLLTISKKYILTRSTNLCSRNHSMLCFWLRRDQQIIPIFIIINFMIRSTEAAICRCSSK